MKWLAFGAVTASTFIGEYEADTKEEAELLAGADARVSVCHECSRKIEDPEISEIIIEARDA